MPLDDKARKALLTKLMPGVTDGRLVVGSDVKHKGSTWRIGRIETRRGSDEVSIVVVRLA